MSTPNGADAPGSDVASIDSAPPTSVLSSFWSNYIEQISPLRQLRSSYSLGLSSGSTPDTTTSSSSNTPPARARTSPGEDEKVAASETASSRYSTPSPTLPPNGDDTTTEEIYSENGTIVSSVASSSVNRHNPHPQLFHQRRPGKDYSSGSSGLPMDDLQRHARSSSDPSEDDVPEVGSPSSVTPQLFRQRPGRNQSSGSSGLSMDGLLRHAHSSSSSTPNEEPPSSSSSSSSSSPPFPSIPSFSQIQPMAAPVISDLHTVASESLSMTPTMVHRVLLAINGRGDDKSSDSDNDQLTAFEQDVGYTSVAQADRSIAPSPHGNNSMVNDNMTNNDVDEGHGGMVAAAGGGAAMAAAVISSSTPDDAPLPHSLEPDMVLCPFCQNEKELQWHLHKERTEYRLAYRIVGVILVLALMMGSFALGTVMARKHLEPVLEAHVAQCQNMLLIHQQEQLERHEQQIQSVMQQQQQQHQRFLLASESWQQQQKVEEGGDFLSTILLTALGGVASGLTEMLASYFLEDAGGAAKIDSMWF